MPEARLMAKSGSSWYECLNGMLDEMRLFEMRWNDLRKSDRPWSLLSRRHSRGDTSSRCHPIFSDGVTLLSAQSNRPSRVVGAEGRMKWKFVRSERILGFSPPRGEIGEVTPGLVATKLSLLAKPLQYAFPALLKWDEEVSFIEKLVRWDRIE